MDEWNEEFIKSPFTGFGYKTYKTAALQAHDEIVGDFMRKHFDLYDENDSWAQSWEDIDEGMDFYETIACDIRIDADWAIEHWLEDTKFYMHHETGSVDSLDGWIDETREDCTAEEIERCIDEGFLIEVVQDEDGSWDVVTD